MAEYRRLSGEGRFEFVTFHQSFSYEDFVEGLRPTTDSEREGDDAEASASGGFRLKPHAGVFKIISERARLDTGDAPTKRLDRSKSIYKVALGRRGSQEDLIREGLDSSLIHLGRSEEHTSELQSLMRNSYAVFCLQKKQKLIRTLRNPHHPNYLINSKICYILRRIMTTCFFFNDTATTDTYT